MNIISKMYTSIVEENYKQPGGGIQMQLVKRLDDTQRVTWFSNARELK